MLLIVRASARVIQYDRRNEKLFPCQPRKHTEGEEVQLYLFFTSASDGGKWSTLWTDAFTPRERKLNRRWAPQGADIFFFFAEEKFHLPFFSGTELRTISL